MTELLIVLAVAALAGLVIVTSTPGAARRTARRVRTAFRSAPGRHRGPSKPHTGGWSAWMRRNR